MTFAIALLLSLCVAPWSGQAAQLDDTSAKLRTPIPQYDLAANNFADALIRAADDFKVPFGIQWVSTPAARQALSLHWSNTTVQEIIEAIARTQPGYEVSVSNGILHVSPTAIAPDQNFLGIRMKSFDAGHHPVDVARVFLWLDLKLKLYPPPEHPVGGYGMSIMSSSDEPILDLKFENTTVEDILDAFIVNSTKKVWLVTFGNTDLLTPTGYRLTSFANGSFPDEQPVWEMLRWSDPLPSTRVGARPTFR
jgi:hypothetical protein